MLLEILQRQLLDLAWAGAVACAFTGLEQLYPVERRPLRSIGFNAVFAVCAYVVVMAEAQIIVPIHVAVATFRDASAMPPSLLSQRLGALELGGRCVLYLLLVDVLQYWRHRALHRWPLLWRFHRLHHDDTAINSVTGRRDHWLNQFIYFLTVLAPATVVFGPLDVPYAVIVGYMASAFFNHANIRLRLGPLTPILCGPQYHRIHHSRLPEHQDKNFAALFPVIDMMFGTYHRPSRDEFPPTGLISGAPAVARHWQAHLDPFRGPR